MSTRRLILLALACGLAILVAGSIQLVRISRSDNTVEVGQQGDTQDVDGVAVTLVDGTSPEEVVVRLEVDSSRDPLLNSAALFSVKAGNERFMPTASTDAAVQACSEVLSVEPGEAVECALSFSPTGDVTRYLYFTLRGKTGIWVLGA